MPETIFRRNRKPAGRNQHPLTTAFHDTVRERWLRKADQNRKQEIHLRRRRKIEGLSIINQFLHLADFALRRARTELDCGALITSIDIDVGSGRLGERNRGRNDSSIHGYLSEQRVGEVEQNTLPALIRFFDNYAIPITFAVRGQLVEVENSIFERILDSPIKHEIAAHGYSHRSFTILSRSEAQKELEMISTGMQKFGLRPKSFVFPKNNVSHLDLLERFGYVSYRDKGGLGKDGMFVCRKGQLYDIHPGFHLGFSYSPIFLDRIIDIATMRKLPFHIWFHPRDIFETRGSTQENIKELLSPLYNYAKKKEKEGTLKFETMQSVVNRIKACS